MNNTYYGFIYLWENTHPTADKYKKYIGQHVGCVEDGYIGSGIIFLKKFYCKKYRNFWKRTILEYCQDQTKLDEAENKYIKDNNAIDSEIFCNIRHGGRTGKLNPSSIIKMKESLKGRIPWNKGKKTGKQSKKLKEKRVKSLMASKQIEREKDYEIIIDLISEKSFLKREDLQNSFKKWKATKRLNDLIKINKLKIFKNKNGEHFYTLNKSL
jgi:hypothetical protein